MSEEIQDNLSIERCPHDRENPYSQINKDLIRDESISPGCRWLLIYLLSNKEGWKISVSQIHNHTKQHRGYGRGCIYKLIKEACKAGYMSKVSWKEGNLKRYKYYLSEFPKFKNSNNFSDIPDSGKPGAGSSQIDTDKEEYRISKDILKNDKITPPHFVFKRVEMKIEAYQKLIQEHGKEKIEQMLERLDEYADINPKRFKQYANHATVIQKWIREEKEKASKKPQDQISTVKEWLGSQKTKQAIELALKQEKIITGNGYIEFKGIRDGYVKFDDPKAKTLIEHYLRKIGSLN